MLRNMSAPNFKLCRDRFCQEVSKLQEGEGANRRLIAVGYDVIFNVLFSGLSSSSSMLGELFAAHSPSAVLISSPFLRPSLMLKDILSFVLADKGHDPRLTWTPDAPPLSHE